jgi:hypothetical protein
MRKNCQSLAYQLAGSFRVCFGASENYEDSMPAPVKVIACQYEKTTTLVIMESASFVSSFAGGHLRLSSMKKKHETTC